jgi:hypothetical protein
MHMLAAETAPVAAAPWMGPPEARQAFDAVVQSACAPRLRAYVTSHWIK